MRAEPPGGQAGSRAVSRGAARYSRRMSVPTRRSSGWLADRDDGAEVVHAVLRSTTWRGPWEPPELMRVVSVLGSVVLDYRDAELPLGETVVECAVYLGNVEIILPPDVDLELSGSVLLGNVESGSDEPWPRERRVGPGADREEERPLLRVECSGVMGNVEVRVSAPEPL